MCNNLNCGYNNILCNSCSQLYDPEGYAEELKTQRKWDKFYKKEKEILFKLDMTIKPHNIDKIEVDILKLVKKYKLKGK